MGPTDDFEINVTADWNDWRSANARCGDLRDVHWHQPRGAPQPLIHAYLSCADIVSGELTHHCDPSAAPHRLRVCVLKSHNVPSSYAALARKADLHVALAAFCLSSESRHACRDGEVVTR